MTPWLTTLALALLIWWMGTGVVLYLQQTLSKHSLFTRWSLLGLGIACVAVLLATQHTVSTAFTVVAFIAAVCLWGTIELSYYLGLVTGLHERNCPPGSKGWQRFRLAVGTSIWHELLTLSLGIGLTLALLGANNPTGLYTYAVLWLMRWSAKLNLFFGVPHFQPDWFPSHFNYLKSYLRRAPVSYFFPISITAATLVVAQLIYLSLNATGAQLLVYSLPATLLALAIVEHGFMVLPIAESRLWNGLFKPQKPSSTGVKR